MNKSYTYTAYRQRCCSTPAQEEQLGRYELLKDNIKKIIDNYNDFANKTNEMYKAGLVPAEFPTMFFHEDDNIVIDLMIKYPQGTKAYEADENMKDHSKGFDTLWKEYAEGKDIGVAQ